MKGTLIIGTCIVAFATVGIANGGNRDFLCTTQAEPVVINLDNLKHKHILQHVRYAEWWGYPRILHIDRPFADKHRTESLNGVPTHKGYDRDEYPPAISREGGDGANIRLVEASENRSAGAVMSSQLRPYCDGQAFRFASP